MDAAIVCPACHWFGVFRADVIGTIAGCPSCGQAKVEVRSLDDDDIHRFGNDLMRDLDASRGPRAEWPPAPGA